MKTLCSSFVNLCKQLSDLEWHHDEQLVKDLALSPTTLHQYIKQLQTYDIPLQVIDNKKYRLNQTLYLLNQDSIKQGIEQPIDLSIAESIASTNTYLHDTRESTTAVCLAEHQTKGRGRFERTWHSPFGQHIYLSLRDQIKKPVNALSGISLAIAVLICRAIETVCQLPEPLQVKWPNDVWYRGKKLAGILIETRTQNNQACILTIGVGINVNCYHAKDIQQASWTSLQAITHQTHNRNPLVIALVNQLFTGLKQFSKTGFQGFIDEWQQRHCFHKKTIQISANGIQYEGQCEGVDSQGCLVMTLPGKQQKTFISGESSLKSVN